MKMRRWLGTALALLLCLPMVRASAAGGQEGLYGAYYKILRGDVDRLGVITDYNGYFSKYYFLWDVGDNPPPPGVLYAELMDFDNNGVDELVCIKLESAFDGDGVEPVMEIYTYANGAAVQVADIDINTGTDKSLYPEVTLTKGSDNRIYYYTSSSAALSYSDNYYSLVNGKWVLAQSLARRFHPDIYISLDVHTSTGTYTYYIGEQEASHDTFYARKNSLESQFVRSYGRGYAAVGDTGAAAYFPAGTVGNLLAKLYAGLSAADKLYYAPPAAWAASQVNAGIADGIVPATLQNSYAQPITRAEFCALATAFYEKYTGTTIPQQVQFSDTQDENVRKMATLGVVSGVGNNRFAPDQQLTREQAAVILGNLATALNNPFPSGSPTFADNAKIANWAAAQVGQVQAAGIMGGVGDNLFSPQGMYTREQSIVTIMRMEWVVVPVSGIQLDQSEVTLRAGQTQTLAPSFTPANATNQNVAWSTSDKKVATVDSQGVVTAVDEGTAVITATAANGVKASCTFHVLNQNYIDFQADLPVTLNCLAFPRGEVPGDDAGTGYLPSDPILAGTVTVTDVKVSNKYVVYDEVDNTRGVTLTCRLDSKVAGLEDQFYPYVKWVVKDKNGKIIDSGLEKEYSNATHKEPGDTFTLTFSLANTVPGEQYTLEFINDQGRELSQVSTDEPTVNVAGLPVTITEERKGDVSTVTVQRAEVTLEYSTRYNNFQCNIAFSGSGSVNSSTQTPRFAWTLTDSSGNVVASGARSVFRSDLEEDGTFYFEPQYEAKGIDLEGGETYTLSITTDN